MIRGITPFLVRGITFIFLLKHTFSIHGSHIQYIQKHISIHAETKKKMLKYIKTN